MSYIAACVADTLLDAIADGFFIALCQNVDMNYFEAIGVFFALAESKPCWQRGE